jgi:hypothetical protein
MPLIGKLVVRHSERHLPDVELDVPFLVLIQEPVICQCSALLLGHDLQDVFLDGDMLKEFLVFCVRKIVLLVDSSRWHEGARSRTLGSVSSSSFREGLDMGWKFARVA